MLEKSEEAINPISNTSYSSILVYKKDDNYFLYSGANIDPDHKEDLKNPDKRNCAEKQAAITAKKFDQFDNANLLFMFLYRKQKKGECIPARKLVPCKDCCEKYLVDLSKNNGWLILILDDNIEREFLEPGHDTSITDKVQSIDLDEDFRVNYKIFGGQSIQFLKIEDELGARVCKL